MSQDHNKSHWEHQAAEHGDSHWASWGDHWIIDLEIETIGSHLKPDDDVLDAGCGNGYSTFRQAEKHRLRSITGIDFAENMIAAAKKAKQGYGGSAAVHFEVGDIRQLRFPDGSFDAVYTTRVLINLPTWELQKLGIEECLRVARSGGKIIFSEGFWEPLVLLNALRALKQLPPLVEHDFNRYLKLSKVEEFLRAKGLAYQVLDFSSLYYLGSRFLRELVTDPCLYPGFSNPINKIFYEIEKDYSGGGFGIQKAVVITK
jgi:ubiquinone/menaquinone biosynthesis C-methylase UbiE